MTSDNLHVGHDYSYSHYHGLLERKSDSHEPYGSQPHFDVNILLNTVDLVRADLSYGHPNIPFVAHISKFT